MGAGTDLENLPDELLDKMNKAIGKDISDIIAEKKHPNPITPLPYKGMDTRTEIASRLMPSIIAIYNKNGSLVSASLIADLVAKDTLVLTDALIKALNEKK